MIVLITGGSGCGKSTYAERLVDTLPKEKRYYIATMRVYDEESVRRVERHRMQRADKGFTTIECPVNLRADEIPEGAVVLFEDLPNIMANEMFDEGGNPERILPEIKKMAQKCSHLIVVTNDVFSDGGDYAESTLEYIRRLAKLNNQAAEFADHVIEVVYSIPVALKGVAPCV